MSPQQKDVVLSRFFESNVQLIAKMCPRCYEECIDVKIVAVNLPFLRQTTNNFQDLNPNILELFNVPDSSSECSEDNCLGFGKDEVTNSTKLHDQFLGVVEDFVKKEVKRNDYNNNTKSQSFTGFSTEEIEDSKEYYEKFSTVSKAVRSKVYKRLSSKVIKNLCGNKIGKSHRKTNRRKLLVPKWPEKESRYFKSEAKVQENQSKYFCINPIKEEDLDLSLEDCKHVKTNTNDDLEVVDYESEYFKGLNRFQVKIKLEDSKVKKEDFEDCIPEQKPAIWIPPRSPHNLIEEVLYHDPWALLVATIFLNRTSCMCARPYVFWFLTENPNALVVLDKSPKDLEKYFVKLGLQRTRALQVWRMSHDFVHTDWKNVKELYGIGKYGENAFRMFCLGDFSAAPDDRFLRIYKAWYEKVRLNESNVIEPNGCCM